MISCLLSHVSCLLSSIFCILSTVFCFLPSVYCLVCLQFTIRIYPVFIRLKGIIWACIRFLMISTGFWKCQSGFVSNGTEYLKCYSFYTERNYSFSYKFLFGRIIRIRLKPTSEAISSLLQLFHHCSSCSYEITSAAMLNGKNCHHVALPQAACKCFLKILLLLNPWRENEKWCDYAAAWLNSSC